MATFFSTSSFSLTQGDTNSINFQYTDSNGNPVDISGGEIYFTSKTNPSLPDSQASIYKTVSSFVSASLGMGSIPIVPADTSSSLAGKYFWDIRFKDVSGNITTLDSDSYYLISSITNNVTGR
jgi:hypothetical protein